MKINKLLYAFLAAITGVITQSCMDEPFRDYLGEYCEEGIETTLSLRVEVPEMDIATRADMPAGADSKLNSLWIGIFNANTGECTYAGYPDEVISDGEIEVTNDLFKTWSGFGKDANPIGVAVDIIKNLNNNLVAGNVIWGPANGTVPGNTYVNLSDYTKLVFEGSENTQVRLIYNRQNMGDTGEYEEIIKPIGSNGRVEFDLTSNKGYDYFHLNSVKVQGVSSGRVTSIRLIKNSDGLSGEHGNYTGYSNIKINTVSGPSYIVAVGNPNGNNGYLYNPSSTDPISAQSLSEILPNNAEDAENKNFTWETYKNIVISRRSPGNVIDVPLSNLVMSGVYYDDRNIHPEPTPAGWEKLGENSVNIYPGIVNNGAIHLRRTISQVKFNIKAVDYSKGSGENANKNGHRIISIEPEAYRIFNAPYTSWLHERRSPGDDTNSGDKIRINNSSLNYTQNSALPLKGNYLNSSLYNGSQHFKEVANQEYEFDFWMLENKRMGSNDKTSYDTREKEWKKETEDTAGETWYENTGIYTALCKDGDETMNNSAAFVEIRCKIDYTDEGMESLAGTTYDDVRIRTAYAVYTVHLGGINNDWSDFTHRRNHKYTYNITVMDVDRIIVETKGNEERPGIEGVVTDVTEPAFILDAHFGVFNICLSNKERTGGSANIYGENGFPFRLEVYDRDNKRIIIDQNNVNEYNFELTDPTYKGREKYTYFWTWVEFRPTTGPNVLAEYKPYHKKDINGDYINEEGYEYDNRTFRLNEIADIITYPGANSSTNLDEDTEQWYTVFINEYVYEASSVEEDNHWVFYTNKNDRICWINTQSEISSDRESAYIKSKYTVIQKSIQTFYDIPNIDSSNTDLNAIGLEHTNEVYGLTLRWATRDKNQWDGNNIEGGGGFSLTNGKRNQRFYLRYEAGQNNTEDIAWARYVTQSTLQKIVGINTNSYQREVQGLTEGQIYYVPSITTYTNFQSAFARFDPNTTYAVAAMEACMNRNRDINGNGMIDREEIRWYLPTSSEIVDLVNGRNSLVTPLMDYSTDNNILISPPMQPIPYNGWSDKPHHVNTRFHYATSNHRLLWAEEGVTINPTTDVNTDWNRMGWQVRCVRALGTDLRVEADLTPAFTVDNPNAPTKVYPTYFEAKTLREPEYGTIAPHYETSYMNRISTTGFEFQQKLITSYTYTYDGNETTIGPLVKNPATHDDPLNRGNEICRQRYGEGWRLPNVKEASVLKLALNNAGLNFNNNDDNGITETGDYQIANFYCNTYREYGVNDPGGTPIRNKRGETDPTGYYLGVIYNHNPSDENQIGRIQCLTTAGQTYYIRCVRDL